MRMMRKLLLLLLFILASRVEGGVRHGDFSHLDFSEAFDSLFAEFLVYYPFTEWKGIGWQGLYHECAPQMVAAQSDHDTSLYKMAMRRFIHSFPDGHVRVRGEFQELFVPEIGGGVGLTLVELDNGALIVNRIVPESPAKQAGIEIGAVVSQWNGLPVNEALQNADILWEGKPPATSEAARLAQIRRLIRMPVGAQVEITFSNPGQNSVTRSLTAIDDGMKTWNMTQFTKFNTNGSVDLSLDDFLKPVEYEILESNHGYLKNRILAEFDQQGNPLPTYDTIYDSVKAAIDHFNTAQVPGVIIDMRDNPGGFDRLAALFGSYFYDHTELYEHASFYNPQTGHFEVIGSFTICIEPQESYYGGPVICLVNTGTSSSAEGVAMAVQRLSHGHVLGFHGTHGSFGLTGGETLMPAGLAVSYPLGRSLDDDLSIQIDSDSARDGGVVPDIRIPCTWENMSAVFVDSEDVELKHAIEYLNHLTSITDSDDHVSQPATVQVYASYPNPFNPQTIIPYYLPRSMHVTISIYNMAGQKMTTLLDNVMEQGCHTAIWNGLGSSGKGVASGVYFFRVATDDGINVHKMVLLR